MGKGKDTFDIRNYMTENQIGFNVNEGKYDTDRDKLKFLKKKGNIVTFKKQIKGRWQAVITKLESGKNGGYRIHGVKGFVSPWYKSADDMMDAIDWEFMEQNH